MLSIDSFREYGADVEEALTRCYGNEEFYLKLVGMMLNEASFANLDKALSENNLNAAFEAAHALKGVCANLALTPLLEPVKEITELLRARTETDYSALNDRIKEEKEKLVKLIGE